MSEACDTPEPCYLPRKKEDFRYYIDYIEEVMDELVSKHKITGIRLDMIAAWYAASPNKTEAGAEWWGRHSCNLERLLRADEAYEQP